MKLFKKLLKIGGIVLATLVALVVIVGVTSGDDSTKTTTEPKVVEKKVDKPKADKPKEQPKPQAKIGDTLKVGDVEFTVNGTSQATNVGGQYGKNAKGKYLVLNITVTNKGKDELLVDSNLFKLKVDGKEYESDSVASVYVNENGDFFLTKLNPDLSVKGNIVFDIPVDLFQKELTLNVQTGYFGTEQGQIVLK